MKRLRWFGLALMLASIIVLLLSVLPGGASGGAGNIKYQWDILNVDFATLTLTQGGHASAFSTHSHDSAHTGEITVSGHGTFRANPGNAHDVTGGGAWQTFDASGNPTGSGNYQVTALVSFHVAPGSLPPPITDLSGNKADVRSGLAVFKIAYDDGSDGTLVVSCDLPVGSPPDIFEGITATKGYVDYWERDPSQTSGNANTTNFHELH